MPMRITSRGCMMSKTGYSSQGVTHSDYPYPVYVCVGFLGAIDLILYKLFGER
jgi:hypothetical protein